MTSATVTLSNKLIFMLGVNTGFVTEGEPDSRYIDFYRQRSSPDLHCAIVGNVVVPGGHGSNRSTPSIGSNPVWTKVADAIRQRGSIPGIQLATAWKGYEGSRKFRSADTTEAISHARELVRAIGHAEVNGVLESFDAAAAIAVDHGFAHVQIHAAHGYLLSLLIDERINSAANLVLDRLRRLAEGLKANGVESSIRISMRTGDAQFDASGAKEFQDRVADLPFDFADLSSGFYNIDKRLIYPSRPEITAARLRESVEIAVRNPARQFIVSGQIAMRSSRLPQNAHIGLCRDLIANPRFLAEPNNGCRSHGKCHYYSRGQDHITCPLWGTAG